MKKMILYTPSGNKFIIEVETGNITQYKDNPVFSGQWKFLGLQHVGKNEFIPFGMIKNNPKILDELTLKYKNGNPQYTVRDLDYGTVRVWGNTKYHGISSLRFE